MTNEYLERIIRPYMDRHCLTKLLLVIDSATCHKTAQFTQKCFFLKFIRPKMTPITLADQAWFGYLKPTISIKVLSFIFIGLCQ